MRGLKLFRLFVCSFLLVIPCLVHAQVKDPRIAVVYGNIYKHFYDSAQHLYFEKTEKEKEDKDFSYLWPLCALIQTANELEALDPAGAQMKPVMAAIDQYYSRRDPHPGYDSYVVRFGGGDRFYDDNQWIGIAYMDAYRRTKQSAYLTLARDIYDFMITGYDTISGGGLYWKEFDSSTKNTCSNGPGVVLGLQLYKATKDQRYLDTAMILFNWTKATLRSPEGLYYDNIRLPARTIDKRVYTYNTGTMLESLVLLFEITGKKEYLDEARQTAAASLQHFYRDGKFPNHYWFNAVLLRGYEALYRHDKDKKYIDAFRKYADHVWKNETGEGQMIGTKKIKALIDQAGFLEIIARLARYN